MRFEVTAVVYDGDAVLGRSTIGVDMPDTSDLDAAHLCLGEGQLNWGKVSEQVGIMAVWDAGRSLQKLIYERDDAIHGDAGTEGLTNAGATVTESATGTISMESPVGEGDSGSVDV